MSTIIAALDSSAAARPVLETALRIGELTGAAVEAVNVRDGFYETPESLAQRANVSFRRLRGPVEDALLEATVSSEVTLLVLGARATTAGRRPVGRTTARILQLARKPVVVVPPEALAPRPFRRLLIPLEGIEADSRAVAGELSELLAVDVELVVLHVFTEENFPRFLDQPARDFEILGEEFVARHLPHAAHIELRTGPVSPRVIEVSAEEGVDLVVLSWSQVTSGERARVVREVLGASLLPTLLLPSPAVRDEHFNGADPQQGISQSVPTS